MSYILEALKKAQAERQLGNSPTIHAPTLQVADEADAAGRWRKPLWLAVLAMGAVIVVLLALVLRRSTSQAAAPAAAPAAAGSAMASAAVAPAVVQPPAVSPATALAAPVASAPPVAASPAPAPAPLPLPDAELPPSVANLARATAPESRSAAAVPASGASVAPGALPAAAKSASDEPVVNLRELPEPIQRAIPSVTVGGYIYSKNPADRLLLVDKVLRHEGEEVAPGLLLEKLQPKEAVFSFKGYRYRVPY